MVGWQVQPAYECELAVQPVMRRVLFLVSLQVAVLQHHHRGSKFQPQQQDQQAQRFSMQASAQVAAIGVLSTG
jgi:hypothetical protein